MSLRQRCCGTNRRHIAEPFRNRLDRGSRRCIGQFFLVCQDQLGKLVFQLAEIPTQVTHFHFPTAADANLARERLLADDEIGAQREHFAEPLPESYFTAFDAINGDANNELVVADSGGKILGMLQLTFIPYLNFQGSWRALIESVHVSSRVRGRGVGSAMMRWAIARAEERGCRIVQLTTDKRRAEAKRFYEKLGFKATHEGMKLHLT